MRGDDANWHLMFFYAATRRAVETTILYNKMCFIYISINLNVWSINLYSPINFSKKIKK